jgi:hypothetical protein
MSEVGWFRRHFGWRIIKVDPLLDDKTETLRRLNWCLLISIGSGVAFLLRVTLMNHPPIEPSPDAVEAVVVYLVMVAVLAGARSLVTHDILEVTWIRDDPNPDQTDR